MVTVSKRWRERVTPVKISDADWKTLIKIFDDITLEELKDLKSPTEKRFMTVQQRQFKKHIKMSPTKHQVLITVFLHSKKISDKINSFVKQDDELRKYKKK
jgi:translation initiation factor 2 beta subunit (eIF-2beta)/eIF-5